MVRAEEEDVDHVEIALRVTDRAQTLPELSRLLELAGPVERPRLRAARATDERESRQLTLEREPSAGQLPIDSRAGPEIAVHRPRKRLGDQLRVAGLLRQLERAMRVPLRLAMVEAVEMHGQLLVDPCLELDVGLRVEQRLLEERALSDEVLGVEQGCELERHPRPVGAMRRLGRRLLEQRSSPCRRSRTEVVIGRRAEASQPRRRIVGRCEPDRDLGELRRGGRGTARTCGGRCLVERRGDLRVRSGRRRAEVPPALLGVADDLGQPTVHVRSLLRRRRAVVRRREQRVRESQPRAVRLDHAL